MCEEAGHPVLKLVRRSFAGVKTQGLAPGVVRPLTGKEVDRLKGLTGLGKPAPPPSREGWALPRSRRPSRPKTGKRKTGGNRPR